MKGSCGLAALLCAFPLCAVASSVALPTPAPAQSVGSPVCSQPDHAATVTKVVQPIYPNSAAASGEGYTSVQVMITIDPSGKIVDSHIYRSSGNAAVDESAQQAALHSQYAPKVVDCTAVTGRYLFRADFAPSDQASGTIDLPQRTGASWDNPFCGASALAIPFNVATNSYAAVSDTYALYVWAHARANYAARVMLIGNGQAYAVDIPRIAYDAARDAESAYLVSLPKGFFVEWYFVDGVGVDDAAIGDCPSFVKPVVPVHDLGPGVPAVPAVSATFEHLNARYVEKLPALSCGAPYTSLEMKNAFSPLVGHFGDRPLSAEVEAFVDSNGFVVKTEIHHSSGVDGIDEAAIAAVEFSTFRPATFLCTPVVGAQLVTIDYAP